MLQNFYFKIFSISHHFWINFKNYLFPPHPGGKKILLSLVLKNFKVTNARNSIISSNNLILRTRLYYKEILWETIILLVKSYSILFILLNTVASEKLLSFAACCVVPPLLKVLWHFLCPNTKTYKNRISKVVKQADTCKEIR